MIHDLKISPKYYDAVLNGYKTFEVRKLDRPYNIGDTVILREFDYKDLDYTGRMNIKAEIRYILTSNDFPDGLQEGYGILGLDRIQPIYEDRFNSTDRVPL